MRRNRKKEDLRLSYIILGLVLGFFLGSGMVYWYFNRQNVSALNERTWAYIAAWLERVQAGEADLHQSEDTFQGFVETIKTNSSLSPKTPEIQAAATDPEPEQADTLQLNVFAEEPLDWLPETAPDTIYPDDAEPATHISPLNQDIRMMQDQLLQTRTFLINPQNGAKDIRTSQWQLDSLLGAESRNRGTQTRINIEFWMSPLYYTGYKKSKNRVIVYGLEQPELAAVRLLNSGLLLRYMDNIYLLEDNEIFQPLVPITDPFILQQLHTP